MEKLFLVVLMAVASLSSVGFSAADELLRVDGRTVKWAPPALGLATMITYTALKRPFSLPDTKKTLSPDNCGAMGAFAEIVAGSDNLTETMAREELGSAFASWEKVAGIKFSEVDEGQRADIVVGAIITSSGRAFANLSLLGGHGMQPVAKALGTSSGNWAVGIDSAAQGKSAATIEQAYVCLNPKQRWKIGFDGNLDVYDLRHTFMHEIGHAIGLDHPGSSGAIMGFRYDEHVRELQPSDIAAAQLLYGPPNDNALHARATEPKNP
jgi:hypothetical protein